MPSSFDTEKLKCFIDLKTNKAWECRLKSVEQEHMTGWSKFLIMPVDNYLETAEGPISLAKIDFIEINSIQTHQAGRLLPKKKINIQRAIEKDLQEIGILYTSKGEHIRIYLSEMSTES